MTKMHPSPRKAGAADLLVATLWLWTTIFGVVSWSCADNIGVALISRERDVFDAGAEATPDGPSTDGPSESDTACTTCCATMPTSAVAWWRGEGNGIDDISGFDLTHDGGFVAGRVGQAFSLDGVDDVAEFPHSELLLPLDSISTEFWIQTTQQSVAVVFALYDCASICAVTGKSAWTVRIGSSGRFSISVRDADGGGPMRASTLA